MAAQKVKASCWEFKKCGRESGGINEFELGICPAYLEVKLNGVHGGQNAGRACWVVAGTFCGGKVQGTFAEKEDNCMRCEFYIKVRNEEKDGSGFQLSSTLISMLAI